MTTFLILSGTLAVLGAVVWIVLLLWAARADGRDQRAFEERRRQGAPPSPRH